MIASIIGKVTTEQSCTQPTSGIGIIKLSDIDGRIIDVQIPNDGFAIAEQTVIIILAVTASDNVDTHIADGMVATIATIEIATEGVFCIHANGHPAVTAQVEIICQQKVFAFTCPMFHIHPIGQARQLHLFINAIRILFCSCTGDWPFRIRP